MPFSKYQIPKYPVRQWLIEGEAGSGKSTFATQLRSPMLLIDADHRWAEVAALVAGDIYSLSQDPLDHISPDRIAELVSTNMAGSGLKSIVVDSLTPIIAPLVTKAFRDNRRGQNRNKVAAYAEKATAMRLLTDVLTGTGCDIAWLYHIYTHRDAQAREEEVTSITELELSRILRSCNMRIRLERAGGGFQARVLWSRTSRAPAFIDSTGKWEGMPERIEAAVYDNLTTTEEAIVAGAAPAVFATPVEAIRWGMDARTDGGDSVFRDEAHAQNAYALVREQFSPTTAAEMRDLWVAEVEARQRGESTVHHAAAPLQEYPEGTEPTEEEQLGNG